MARLFNGDNQYGSASSVDLSAVNKCTVAFRLYWDTNANDNDIALRFGTGVAGTFSIQPNNSSTNFQIALQGDVGFSTVQFTRPSAAAWHHYVVLMDMSKSSHEVDSVYIDNSSQSLTWTVDANNTGNFINGTLYFMANATPALFGAGRLCEVAIWPGVLLDVDEIAAFSKGVTPLLIRPTAKPYYWPIRGRPDDAGAAGTDTEPELFYGASVSFHGDATHEPPPYVEGP